MTKPRQIPFSKFHGLGNDFIVIAAEHTRASASSGIFSQLAVAICERHTGVGADGLAVVLPARSKKNDARVRFFNPDGSEAEMSGNGIRCAAAFVYSGAGDRPTRTTTPLRIETLAGVKLIDTIKAGATKWIFRVGMGAPVFKPEKIPFEVKSARAPVVRFPLTVQGRTVPATVTSMGNPHCTVVVDDFPTDWPALGRAIETNSLFPNRTNVEFVRVVSRNELEVRFWERGVGQTQSSGTGSCAAVVACILNGLTSRKVRVRTLAGTLEVAWPERGEVALTGPVERIAEGKYYGNYE